ncbi:unnamed protein product [Miscanthus lutarioriparius]|uniref:Uncharacterized protein n=1 Tax=Miscanthus lutarioriparius TaxID=422564 RepID=A0A811QGT4_9POAL|nr:unnamed protein product [Miscanthus lutarioriparius]
MAAARPRACTGTSPCPCSNTAEHPLRGVVPVAVPRLRRTPPRRRIRLLLFNDGRSTPKPTPAPARTSRSPHAGPASCPIVAGHTLWPADQSREEVLCVGRSHLASLQPPLPRVAPSRPRPCPSPAWRHTVARSTPRCMPQRSYTVATKTCVDEVHVYHLGDGDGSGKSGADVVLRGHEAEGYGLSWSPMKEGWLLSGSYDKKICLWDLSSGSGAPVLDAQQVFEVNWR